MMAIPRRRVVLHQPVHDLLAEEELKGDRQVEIYPGLSFSTSVI